MRTSDLDLVVRNEEAASGGQPWSKRIFIDCLRAGYQCWVLASDDRLIGHGVLSVAIGECHLLSLCVHPEYQRMGQGRRLLQFLLERGERQNAEICFLEVRYSNLAARSLYSSLGFIPVGERKDYYPAPGGREDAVIMSRNLPR